MNKTKQKYPKEFLNYVQSITNRRIKVVIDHILQYEFVTTEDLENIYGYNHPPRAARDVREAGIPLDTFKVKSKDGKLIAAYKFGDPRQLQVSRISGRTTFPKNFRRNMFESSNGKCAICNGIFTEKYLQIDHRVPYEVGGDIVKSRNINDFMLLCGSCNRIKSWSCEHCDNWKKDKNEDLCLECYWGNPTDYRHIALKDIRRLDMQWEGEDVTHYNRLKMIADSQNIELPEFVKQLIADKL